MEENKQVEEKQEEQVTEETYTRSDVDREISKAVETAINNQRKKWEEEKQAEIERAKNEAAEYAKMTQKEKEEAELKRKLEEIEKREQELNQRELLAQIKSDLQENELPTELAETFIGLQDNEKIKANIKSVKELIDKEINNRVKERLRQDTPEESVGEVKTDPFTEKLRKYQ